MEFDFYETYKGLSTAELLLIVHRPDEFQPEAVEAATRRLSERVVTPEEQAAVQIFFEDSDHEARRKAEKMDQLKGQAADLLQPILQPGANVTPQKWLNLFLLMLGLQYSWTLVQTLIAMYKSVASHLLDLNFLINIITLIYLPLFFYLLYKRKRWGWILVFAGILVGILGTPVQMYSYSVYLRAFERGRMGITTMGSFVFQALLRIAFAWFLWRQDVCDLFGVDKSTKMKTLVYTSVITLVFFGVILIIVR